MLTSSGSAHPHLTADPVLRGRGAATGNTALMSYLLQCLLLHTLIYDLFNVALMLFIKMFVFFVYRLLTES